MEIRKDFKWTDGFANGNIYHRLLYNAMYGQNPDYYQFRSDRDVDILKMDIEAIKARYEDCIINVTKYQTDRKNSSVEYEFEFDMPLIESSMSINIIDIKNGVYYLVDESTIAIYHPQGTDGKKLFEDFKEFLIFSEEVSKEAEIKLVAYSDGDYYTINSKVNKVETNLDINYNDDIKDVYDNIKQFLTERKSGLAILRGKVGTGKSYLIRSLLTDFPREYILVTNAVAEHLASPEFISFMLDHRDSVFILEDCEQILIDRKQNLFGGAISNILNMSDGLLSDIFNIKFICTFNCDITKIDPALLRKGRCFVNYEFKDLCVEKTKKLLNSRGIYLKDYHPMALTDIYNYEDASCTEEDKKKIGF